MINIANYAKQTLIENYKQSSSTSFSEWAKLEAESDPDFYRWIFNNHEISDFGSNLTKEEKQIAIDFINSLKN